MANMAVRCGGTAPVVLRTSTASCAFRHMPCGLSLTCAIGIGCTGKQMSRNRAIHAGVRKMMGVNCLVSCGGMTSVRSSSRGTSTH